MKRDVIIGLLVCLVGCGLATHAPAPDQSCCHCLVEIDCLQGSPTEAQCEEHIDDPAWLPVALVPWEQDCTVDVDACGSWCGR